MAVTKTRTGCPTSAARGVKLAPVAPGTRVPPTYHAYASWGVGTASGTVATSGVPTSAVGGRLGRGHGVSSPAATGPDAATVRVTGV